MTENTTQPSEIDRVLYRRDLSEELRVGSECIRRWMRAGKLPPPDVYVSRKTIGWRLSTLRAAGINLV